MYFILVFITIQSCRPQQCWTTRNEKLASFANRTTDARTVPAAHVPHTNANALEHATMAEETTTPTLKEFTLEDVKAHNIASDCWMIISEDGERRVYDVTAFLDDHPGGPEIMIDLAGQDATAEFEDIGHSNDARAQLKSLLVGKVKGDVKQVKPAAGAGKSVNGRKDVSGNNGPLFLVLAGIVGVVALFLQFGSAQ